VKTLCRIWIIGEASDRNPDSAHVVLIVHEPAR
jgi:hypothetical protein